ncbi:MAG: bifunctional UDP-sugar hydrolase/5'-nucleotidase [Bacteroidales bacterium]|nr:bifunctional UDP-sugar hydrolase/5'-nucleotidase [Bacteroidales bacterium]
MNKALFTLYLLLFSVNFFSQNKINSESFTGTIKILHTNDIHGNFSRFPRLAFVVDSIRNENENVLLLNAGDIFTGNPLVDMNEEKGHQMIELMNKLAFDLSILGNHEFDYGQEVLAKRISEATFPFICANIWQDGGVLPIPDPIKTIKASNNLNINVLGLLDNSANGLPESHPRRLKGLKFTNPIATAKKFEHLKNNCNLFIALTHLGKRQDIQLAETMPAIDIIIGGHSHTIIDTLLIINGVLITQADAHVRYLGEITVKFKNGDIVEKTSKLISLSSGGNIDKAVEKMINYYVQNPILNEVIGAAIEDLKGDEELGCFYADALKTEANLDIVFQNSGGIRIDEIQKGNIKREQIYRLDPFGNYLMVLEMNVDEIKSLIKSSFSHGSIDLRVSGINYTIFIENKSLINIQLTDNAGNKIDGDKRFKVGINDYILSSYQFEHQDPGQSFGATTAELLISYLQKKKTINYKGMQRTFIQNN